MTACTEFSIPGYAHLIQNFLELGYVPRVFDDTVMMSDGDLLLRHDVDYCLQSACEMARAEEALGVQATYFILLRSPLFNPFGHGEAEILREISRLGGSVGLHFDASYYPGLSVEQLEVEAKREAGILERLVNREIRTLSFHKPPLEVRSRAARFGGLVHSSLPMFMDDILYCSDTLGIFGHGEPLDKLEVQNRNPVQLLTHPIWWSESADLTGLEKLDRLFERRTRLTNQAIARSVTAYRERANQTGAESATTEETSK